MSLYVDTIAQFPDTGTVTTTAEWHSTTPLLAVASYTQDKGGFVNLFDELGEPLRDVTVPCHSVAQVSNLVWHPEKPLLVVSWEDGSLKAWDGSSKEFQVVSAPHNSPVNTMAFSEKGGRLVTADAAGSLVGWKVDSRNQLLTAFHHDLRETVTHVTFRLSVHGKTVQKEIENLARAAVNGDEQALDLFSNWRPKTAASKISVHTNTSDNHCFYVATQSGIVYYVNQAGNCIEVLNTEGQPIMNILYHQTKDSLIIMMDGLTVGHFSVSNNGQLSELVKVKLTGKSQAFFGANHQGIVWAGPGLLAVLTGDLTVRVWDIENSDNYILPVKMNKISDEERRPSGHSPPIFTCISFCKLNNVLCAATNFGQLYFWSRNNSVKSFENPEDAWILKNVNNITGAVKQIFWGSINMIVPLIALNCITKVCILKEQTLSTFYSEHLWATQISALEIVLTTEKSNTVLKTDIQISSITLNKNYVAISNGKTIVIYEVTWNAENYEENEDLSSSNKSKSKDFFIKLLYSFQCENEKILIYDKVILVLTPAGVQFRSLNGIPTNTMSTTSIEGEQIGVDLNNHYLTIFTMNGYIKVYDLSKVEPKLISSPKNIYDTCDDFGEVILAKSNCTGTKVAFTIASANLIPVQKLFIWDIENDSLQEYDFGEDAVNSINKEDLNENVAANKIQNAKISANRVPISFFWDSEDPRLLVCSARKLERDIGNGEGNTDYSYSYETTTIQSEDVEKKCSPLIKAHHIILTMFISSEHDIVIKEIQSFQPDIQLVALSCPYVATLENGSIVRYLMTDFSGLKKHDKDTKKALLDFSYNLSLGNMDSAIKAIRLLPNGGEAWRSLARVCVSTCRVDVARVCLGHVGAAREARALRLALQDPTLEREAVVAMLAVQLGLLDEAEQLYKQCGRYDLLNKFYRARNKFPEALEIAQQHNRINTKSTAFAWAKVLEAAGDVTAAIKKYEDAGCQKNVPKMLLDKPKELEDYIKKSGNKELLKWWGQYIESTGDMPGALKIYEMADDIFSQVRVLCYLRQDSKAANLARTTGNKAACHHVASHYESNDDVENAISFYNKAHAYSNAIRLCKEHGFTDILWNTASVADKRNKHECAKYFESLNIIDKAILLYHQAGMLHKAVDLAFKFKQYETLQSVAMDLDKNSDPRLIQKCATYFVENQQFEKAVDLLAVGKKYLEALDICLEYNVQVTETLAEHLTPDKDELDEETRISVLEKLGESLQTQGNYHLATKTFTQAGNKIRAMKSLLKSGDTEKIVFFAGVSRQKEIYVMAANYLQSLDWQNQPDILRNIITFYSKGRALDLLANFYVACAQVEIDEFQNYEKALGALNEASNTLNKITTPRDITKHKRATELVNAQIIAIKRFVDVRRLFERNNIPEGITQCRQLLNSNDSDVKKYIRKGDIYALMIQHTLNNGDIPRAKILVSELQQHLNESGNVTLSYYLSGELIQALAKSFGISVSTLVPPTSKHKKEDEDETETNEFEQDIQEELNEG